MNTSKGLVIATTLYGLLYAWFVVVSFIPAPEGNWISSTVPYDPYDLEGIGVKLLFVIFVIGYLFLWKHKGIGGAVFIIWWIAMWCFEVFVVYQIKGGDAGGGILMGLPLFILGILFVRNWHKYKNKNATNSTL